MAAGAAALGREGGEDAFRRLFRFYRQRDAADLRGVVDFSAPGGQVTARRRRPHSVGPGAAGWHGGAAPACLHPREDPSSVPEPFPRRRGAEGPYGAGGGRLTKGSAHRALHDGRRRPPRWGAERPGPGHRLGGAPRVGCHGWGWCCCAELLHETGGCEGCWCSRAYPRSCHSNWNPLCRDTISAYACLLLLLDKFKRGSVISKASTRSVCYWREPNRLSLFSGPARYLGPGKTWRARKGPGCVCAARGTRGWNWGSPLLSEVPFPVVSTTTWFSREWESLWKLYLCGSVVSPCGWSAVESSPWSSSPILSPNKRVTDPSWRSIKIWIPYETMQIMRVGV